MRNRRFDSRTRRLFCLEIFRGVSLRSEEGARSLCRISKLASPVSQYSRWKCATTQLRHVQTLTAVHVRVYTGVEEGLGSMMNALYVLSSLVLTQIGVISMCGEDARYPSRDNMAQGIPERGEGICIFSCECQDPMSLIPLRSGPYQTRH